jgi:hypothetical protein
MGIIWPYKAYIDDKKAQKVKRYYIGESAKQGGMAIARYYA